MMSVNSEGEPLLYHRDVIDDSTVDFQSRDGVTTSRQRKKGLGILYLAALLYCAAYYPLFVTMDQYVTEVLMEDANITDPYTKHGRHECLHGNNSHEKSIKDHIQSEASNWMTVINAAGLLPQFVITFLLAPCSDNIGRKITLLVPPAGGAVRVLICILVVQYNGPYWWLVIASVIDGISGSFPLFYAGCISTIADLTTEEICPFWLCLLDITAMLGAMFSNVGTGYVIQKLNYIWMFSILGGILISNTLVVLLLMTESLQEKADVKIFTIKHFKDTIKVYTKDNGTNRRLKLVMLLCIVCLYNLGNINNGDVVTLFLLIPPLCMTPVMIGFFFALMCLIQTIGGVVLMQVNMLYFFLLFIQYHLHALRYYIIDLRALLFMFNLSQASTSAVGPIDTKICIVNL